MKKETNLTVNKYQRKAATRVTDKMTAKQLKYMLHMSFIKFKTRVAN